VRHLRMVGACLIAMFTVAAMVAGPAMAKDPYTHETWGQYKYCPYEEPIGNVTDCFAGITAGGSKGGYFEYGHVKVKLSQSITLQGGFRGGGQTVEVVAATNGGLTLEAPELKVTGGIAILTKAIQQEAAWPQALKDSWKEAKKAKENAVYAKIELAGTKLYEVPGSLSTENILFETGDAFKLPLKVKVTSPWLAKLGGGPCYIGSDENPVMQHLTTGGAGRGVTQFLANEEFTNLFLEGSKLVDLGWHIDAASAPSGCGGEYETFVNDALSKALEMGNPARTGITVLQGNLHDAAKTAVVEAAEKGEL
jgi:hypothetical protein